MLVEKNFSYFVVLYFALFSPILLAEESQNYTMISLSDERKEMLISVSRKTYGRTLAKIVTFFESATHKAINKTTFKKKGHWDLASIEVGPVVSASIGIGPWSIGGLVGFKLYFENVELP